jgi:plasmid replication initiation protein
MIVSYKKQSKELSQKNEFVRKSFYNELTINDLKLFKLIISKIDNNTTLFKDFYIIDYNDLDYLEIPKKDRFQLVKESLKKLANHYIEFDKDDKTIELGLIKNKFIYERYTNKILISIDEDLTEYLLNLKTQYLKYDIENLRHLKTKQELKLYEYIKSFSSNYHALELTIEELKKLLEIDLTLYKEYGNFKQKILNKTIKRINENTDLKITILEKKEHRKIVSIRFIFDNYVVGTHDNEKKKLLKKILTI